MDVAGSAIGIASLGIRICQNLFAYYDDWKDYKSDIKSTYDSIADLSRTLTLLKASLSSEELDVEKSDRVKSCLQSCESGLHKLSEKSQKLRSYGQPEGLRQKAWTELQRSWYPFRASTLMKLREIVNEILERLKLAIQVLQLDVSTSSQKVLAEVAARTETIKASLAQVAIQNRCLLDIQQSEQFKKVVEWLSPPDPWTNHASARQHHEPHTGSWLLQSAEYQSWKTGKTSHLWLHGKAGCGKTILCSSLIEDIRSHCNTCANSGYGVFYFTFSDDQKQSYRKFLLSLVAQLGWKEPALSMLLQAYGKPQQSLLGLDDLEKILLASLQSYDHVYVLLDALDECPEDGELRQQVLEGLERLSQRTSNLRILVTSRDLLDIRESMKKLTAESISVATCSVDADISTYLSKELSCDRKLCRFEPGTKELVKKTILNGSNGMFRWVYCQLLELKKLKSIKPKYVEKTLLSLPPTLDETYERMLNGIEEIFHEEALRLLQWLAYARWPPSLEELAEAAIIDPQTDIGVDMANRGGSEETLDILAGLVVIQTAYPEEDKSDEYSDISQPDDVTDDTSSMCSNQPVGGNRKLQFAHFSVKEYLESKRILQSKAKIFYLESSIGHKCLAQSCLTYLLYYSSSSEKTSTEQDLVDFPLLEYAAQEWYYHSACSQQSGGTTLEISFLSSESAKRDWLLLHDPEVPWMPPFQTDASSVGSVLYYASLLGLETAVRGLLLAGIDVNTRGVEYGNALSVAAAEGHLLIVKLLIESGANIHEQTSNHESALTPASSSGHEGVVRELLAAGADINMQVMKHREHWSILHNSALQAASRSGHHQVVQLLLSKGADVNARDKMYATALQAASRSGHHQVVQLLLSNGADVNARDKLYATALQAASRSGYLQVVQLLLSKGADVNAPRGVPYGTALQAASIEGSQRVVQLLLERGADVNTPGGPYGTALQAASYCGQQEVVQLLLDKGADVNGPDGPFGSALQVALEKGHTQIVSLLQEKHASINT